MKKLAFKKNNFIALALTAVVAVSGFSFYKASAATLIDENEQCKITVQIPTASSYDENEHSSISDGIIMYDKDVTVKFYKIADVKLDGSYDTPLIDIDLSVLANEKVTAKQWEALTNQAYEAFKASTPTCKLTINPSNETSKSINVDRGLYLYTCDDIVSDAYKYTFTKSIISVPSSYLVQGSTKLDENGMIIEAPTSDKWLYNVDVALKSEAEPRFGSIQIDKTLKNFNKSLGNAAFVFEVTATVDDEIVFSNVYTMNFDSAATQSIKVDNLPATAKVIVKEVYTGASYSVDSNASASKEVTVDASKVQKVDFTNDYDNRLELGGISVENRFEYDENGQIKWTKSVGGGN
ncbi:hypothetical protein SAMN04487830_11547 [Pseudobutyrivibrio sp. OR37]|uniref:DUF5979 domain-containing protein n=1 Tax=Pseudobutyrivibrio sp. OR37 TaxID=1798186 RepID=UPI0008E45B0B|nr:DUF5979 domain-containing protein [Pseudobutyrivibrio sp. OR37]SFH97921.1 hypothetical protein SAMN04487830_11547 [Pseudobutyrivibrio sp. OR37]